MNKYFNIPLEFDHDSLEEKIINASLKSKGYCCFVDSNVMVEANNKNQKEILDVLMGSLVNSCDGSVLAKMASLTHKQKLKAYNGPQFFNKFIYLPYNQCVIGNTAKVFLNIKTKLGRGGDSSNLHFIPLPFKDIDEFNYPAIAKEINAIQPRLIWVSLGAPKQEIFMNKLLPHLNTGVMLGVGAALNYFSGEINDIPNWATRYNLIWLFRIMTEPKKQLKRVFKIVKHYPKIYLAERRKLNEKYR